MSHFYISQSYVDASSRIDQACLWLETLGIEYSRTRVGKYRALFEELAKSQLANSLHDFYEHYSFEEWVNAAHEVAELARIYEGLSQQNDPRLVARLRDALKGQELYVLDSEDRSGRDFSLELSIAAKFARAGYSVDFGHDADLKLVIEGREFYVECKRLKSESKIQRRIKDGLAQLHKRYVKSDHPARARGMLVVSTGKIVNEKLGLLTGNTPKLLGEIAFSHNRIFIERYKSFWQNHADRRTLGVAVVLDAPGIISEHKKLVTVHEVTLNNCVSPTTDGYAVFTHIVHNVFPKRSD